MGDSVEGLAAVKLGNLHCSHLIYPAGPAIMNPYIVIGVFKQLYISHRIDQ